MAEKYVLNVKIDGMHCGSCINHIDHILMPFSPIKVDINITRRMGQILFEDEQALGDAMVEAINDAGYDATKLSVLDAKDFSF